MEFPNIQFPICRERLQRIAAEIEEVETKKSIQLLVEQLSWNIIAKAYTESRNRSSNPYSLAEALVSKNRLQGQKSTLMIQLPLSVPLKQNSMMYFPLDTKPLLPLILEQLQEKFPGVSFLVDPLKTYILVDWS
jgi:hypothetical protein